MSICTSNIAASVSLILPVLAVMVCCSVPVFAANGTPSYFDVNGTVAGFGTPSGTNLLSGLYWTPDPTGVAAPATYPSGAQFTIGNAGSDFNGCNITINFDVGNPPNFVGLAVNSANVTVNLIGGGNFFQGGAGTWFVAAGSVLNEAVTMGGKGLNWNNGVTTLSGGGVINFRTVFGYNNSSSRVTENDGGAGLTVNMYTNRSISDACGSSFVLVSGNLNFASLLATNALGTGSVVLAGGKIDNTSGSSMTLCDMSSYTISNGFTFAGSSSLNLGMPNVTLAANSTITVVSNSLTVGGSISGTYSIAKAGAGTLALDGTNIYTGVTTISNGALLVNGSLTAGGVTVKSGGVLGGTGVVNDAVSVQAGGMLAAGGSNTIGTLTINSNVTVSGTLHVDINGSGQCDLLNVAGVLNISSSSLNITSPLNVGNSDCVIASYTSLFGRFANTLNLPPGYVVSYNYKGKNKIAVALPQGMVIRVR